ATGNTVKPEKLPFFGFGTSADGSINVTVDNKRWTCDKAGKGCTAGSMLPAPPRNSSLSPDSSTAAFIRDHNLFAVNRSIAAETELTTDGVKDFGSATNNAGWVHSDNPVLTWSPDGQRIATFQHDGRGVRDMVLAGTNPGAPTLEQWKYPLPGDSVVFRI